MIVTSATRERSQRIRFEHDFQRKAPKAYSFERAGRLWVPPERRLQFIGGGPCGAFAARCGGGDPLWQPTTVSGFNLDADPKHQLTTGLDGARVTCATLVNNAPGATDPFSNGNPSLQPTYEPVGWGGSYVAPSVLFNGSAYYLTCSTGLATALVGGTDTPFWLFIVGQFVALPTLGTAACPIFIGRSVSNNPLWDVSINAAGTYTIFKRPDTGGAGGSQAGGTPDTSRHIFSYDNAATPTVDFKQDGAAGFSGALSAGGTLTVDRIALGATYGNSSPGNWANFRLGRALAGTGIAGTRAISAPDFSYVMSGLNTFYF